MTEIASKLCMTIIRNGSRVKNSICLMQRPATMWMNWAQYCNTRDLHQRPAATEDEITLLEEKFREIFYLDS